MSNIEEDIKSKDFIEAYKEIKNNAFVIKSIDKDFFFELVDYLLEQQEKDYKKIKQLEEENATLRKANNITKELTKEVKIEDITKVMNKSYEEFMKNFIPKQKVKDKIEKLKTDLRFIACNKDCSKCFNKEGKALYRENNFIFCYAYHQIKILQELLEDK